MIKAEELALKYDKEINRNFRSIKSIERRLVRLAKAGLGIANLSVSPKTIKEIVEVLERRGYIVTTIDDRNIEIRW